MPTLFTRNKAEQLQQMYDQMTGLAIALNSIESLCKNKLHDFLTRYGKVLDIEHEQGVPHTAVDFNDPLPDGNDTPKQKRICGLYSKKNKIVAQFTDGTESDYFAFDDIAYLIEEIYLEYVLDDVREEEES